MDIILYIKCLATGMIAGLVFALLKLPVPAPPAIEGIIGILGLFLGYKIITLFIGG